MDEQSGGTSRFFYQAKVSKKERNMGLDGFEEKERFRLYETDTIKNWSEDSIKYQKRNPQKNNHPTVKPINLLTYLVRMVTPPNGVVLDAYMGSGSTGIAALLEGFKFIGMEMDDDYFNIAEARINNYEEYRKLLK
jgi:site-specific DNA-methyltransferase (adenine-specific)